MSLAEGDVAIVTGGGSGIGEAITRCLVNSGCSVLIGGRREAPLKALCDELPGAVSYILTDVTVPKDRKALIEAAIDRYGKLDALINNVTWSTRSVQLS
jgi:NADP-dependent 3-hydroxy acid dehydrogenase YdfG